MLVDSKYYTLEDNNEYEVYDSIEDGNNTYLLLAEVNNIRNIVIRNLVYDQATGEETIERIEESKFDDIYNRFIKKNQDLFE